MNERSVDGPFYRADLLEPMSLLDSKETANGGVFQLASKTFVTLILERRLAKWESIDPPSRDELRKVRMIPRKLQLVSISKIRLKRSNGCSTD